MSLRQRLFPASELESLCKYAYGNVPESRPSKRRRTDSIHSSISLPSTVADSGYDSGDDVSLKHSPAASEPETAINATSCKVSTTVSTQKRRRVNSEPINSSSAPSAILQTHLSTTPPAYGRGNTQSWPSKASSSGAGQAGIRDPDLEIISAQHQIALARQRLHSFSTLVPTSQPDRSDIGWTAGPKAACSSNLSTRLFDGCRIMSHERSFLDSLVDPSQSAVEQKQEPKVQLTSHEKKQVEEEVKFKGIIMPANLYDEELEYEPGAYHDETAGSSFDDFFKLEEASSIGAEVLRA